MNIEKYILQLKEKMLVYYDPEPNSSLCEIIHADSCFCLRAIGSRHMLSKKVVLWSIGEFEHCFIRTLPGELRWEDIEETISGLETVRKLVVEPGPEHKRTVIRCLFVTEDNPEKVRKRILKFKSEVNYKLMLHGWSEISIVVINPVSGVIIHNSRKAQDIKYINALFSSKEK